MKLELYRSLSRRWLLRERGSFFDAIVTKNQVAIMLSTNIKTFVKFQVRGTALEPLARWTWDIINPPSTDILVSRQDDTYITQIMSRILTRTSNCIDIGCYEGDFLSSMFQFAPLGHHYAFEPIPRLAKKLKQKFPRIDVRQIALSDSEQEVTFHNVVSKPAYSGMQKRTYPDPKELVEVIKVNNQRLDNVIDPNFKVHLIKIDVEGAELLVLKGAIRTLKTHKPYIVFEHGQGAANHYATTPVMIYELLVHECGLKIYILKDWLDGLNSLNQEQFVSTYEHGSIWNYLATP